MNIAILVTGGPPEELQVQFPNYAQMVRQALGSQFAYREFDATSGELPDRAGDTDGCIITGSASSVHDPLPWIGELKRWVIASRIDLPIVGICFGHQILAEALGGKVGRTAQGWQGGLRTFDVSDSVPWSNRTGSFTLPIAHEDEVVAKPPNAAVLASHLNCRYAALLYSNRKIASFQAHPEFRAEYSRALVDVYERRGSISSLAAENARLSLLMKMSDLEIAADWIRRFLGTTLPT